MLRTISYCLFALSPAALASTSPLLYPPRLLFCREWRQKEKRRRKKKRVKKKHDVERNARRQIIRGRMYNIGAAGHDECG